MVAESWRQDPAREGVWRFRLRPGLSFQSGDALRRGRRRRRPAAARRPGRGADQRVLLAKRRRRPLRGRRGARASCTSRAPACRGCCARGTRRSTTRRAAGRPARSSAGRPATAPARSRSSSPSRARTSTSPAGTATAARARVAAEPGRRRTSTAIRWIPILDDRERAAALERGEIDCLQNASLLDVDRLAANPELEVIEFQQSALVYMGLDHQRVRPDVRVRRAISHAIDRQALVDARPRRPRLAGVLADPVALAVVRAGGRGAGRVRPARRQRSCSTPPGSRPAPTASDSSWRRSS